MVNREWSYGVAGAGWSCGGATAAASIHDSLFTLLSPSRRELELEGVAVALRIGGLKLDFARAAGGVDLELEEAVAGGERLAARAADGVAGLRAPPDEVDLSRDVFDLHVRDRDRVARAALDFDDELLRLAPVGGLARLRHRHHAPEVVALPHVLDRDLVGLQLVALDELAGGDEEGRGGDLDAVVRGRAGLRLLPLERHGGRALSAGGDALKVARGDGQRRGQQLLLIRDGALLVAGGVLARAQRRRIAARGAGFDRALPDADGLGLVLADMETGVGLGVEAALGQVRPDDVLRALVLLLGADVDLAALDRDAHLGLPAALGRGVLGDGDDRVGLDEESRAVGERDARAPVLLCLDEVAGEEARVGARLQALARVGAHDLHAAFERDEARTGGRALGFGRALKGVAVGPDVETDTGDDDEERDDDDDDVDEPLLDDPPVAFETTESGDHVGAFGLNRSPAGRQRSP